MLTVRAGRWWAWQAVPGWEEGLATCTRTRVRQGDLGTSWPARDLRGLSVLLANLLTHDALPSCAGLLLELDTADVHCMQLPIPS
jgi:hypothetical protein